MCLKAERERLSLSTLPCAGCGAAPAHLQPISSAEPAGSANKTFLAVDLNCSLGYWDQFLDWSRNQQQGQVFPWWGLAEFKLAVP